MEREKDEKHLSKAFVKFLRSGIKRLDFELDTDLPDLIIRKLKEINNGKRRDNR